MNRMGTMVRPETIGNITRPPYRSVRAPTTIRPSEPTMTGTATMSATSDSLSVPRVPFSRNKGPSGLISAQAQKLTANPRVAMASISHGEPTVSRVRRSVGVDSSIGAVMIAVLPSSSWLPPLRMLLVLPMVSVSRIGALQGESPCLGAALAVGHREGSWPAPVDLVEQRQRVMGRDQLQAGARLDGLQRPEDRRVPDRVWDRAHVQLGIPRTVDLTARAGVATAPGADVVRTQGAGLGRLAEQLVHATEQVMQRDARGRGQQRHHQLVLLGQVGVEDLPQGGGRRGSPEQVVDLCHVTQQLGQNLV